MKRIPASLVVLALFVVGISAQVKTSPDLPDTFKTDGCSMFPDGNYRECCVEHDRAYFVGGSLRERRAADKELYRCVRSKGNGKLLASMIFVGVRVGGVSFLPTPFRWGFGHKFPRKEPVKPQGKTLTDR
jgi:hypothetical protein